MGKALQSACGRSASKARRRRRGNLNHRGLACSPGCFPGHRGGARTRLLRRAENDRVVGRSASMKLSPGGVLVAAMACLALLGGCETSTKLGNLLGSSTSGEATGSLAAAPTPNDPTGSLAAAVAGPPGSGGLLGSDPNDDLNLGKKHFRAGNFGIAEGHFRRAVELHPRDAEAWVGLAACYDRLRRFELADRAYNQAIEIIGP